MGDGYKTTYDIGVVVKDVPLSGAVSTNGAALADTLLVTVEVTNVEEAGSVVLSPLLPRVGVPLVARLTDPDEGLTFTGASWAWQRQADDTADWQPVSTGAAGARENDPELSSYAPKASDVGYHLRAVVDPYRDALGAGKRAHSDPSLAVQAGVPDPPMLTASGLNRTVRLSIRLGAANGSPITRTETRIYSLDPSTGDTTWVTTRGRWRQSSIDPSSSHYSSLFTAGWNHTYSSLSNGVPYTFEVRSVNGVGPSAVASITVRPEAVQVLPLTVSRGDGQVVLRWTAPTNSATIAGYQVRQRISDSGQDWSSWATVPGGISARDTTVTGLTNGVTYQFAVQAVNNEGSSVAVSNTMSATPAAVPDVPPHFMPFPGDRQVLLEWEAAANNGSRITHYEIQWRQVSDPAQAWSIWAEVSGGRSARDTTVTGLTNGQRYEFAVRAVNGVGEGTSIAQVAMPRALSLTASGGDGQVGLNWTFSAHSSTIAHYQVRHRVSDSGQDWSSWATVPGGTSARDTTVTGLTNGVTYQFQAQAIDSQDALISVSNVVSATPAAVPDAPPHFMPSPGDGQVVLRWEAAANNGSRITHYKIQWRQMSDPAQAWSIWAEVSGGRSARDTTVTGLTNGQRYEFAVRAVNGVGDGASIAQSAMPRPPAPGPVRNLSAEGGSVSGSIAVSWDAPNTGGTPALYRVEYRQGSAAWQAGGTTTQTRLSIGDLVGGSNYSIQVRAENGGGNSSWRSTTATATNSTETEYAYRLHDSGTTAPTFSASASSVPTGWSSSRQTPTSSNRYEWRIRRTRPTGGSWSNWGSATVVVEAEYAYRASQTAPLFDTGASGTPDNWSSSELTWTDAAPRVWSIRRTSPSGGPWSAWGTLEKYSERPVAQPAPFYRQAASQPDPPGNTISSATPTDWQTANPGATATESVWRTERTRPAGETHYRFSTPIQIETEYAYRLHTSGTTAPSFTASASSVPTDWSSSRQPPTSAYAPYEWQIRRTRPTGGTWSSWGSATVVSRYTERQTAYKRNDSGTTAPAFSSTASGVPYGWSSSQPSATSSNRYVWRITRTRPAGDSWSSWGSATVVSRYTERQTAYKRNDSGTTAPAFSSTASGVPYGWSSSQPSATSSNRYVWQISRTRPAGGSWSSWGSATVVSRYTERQTAYKRNDSGTTAPAFSSTASGLPYGWSSSQPSATSSNRYVWQITRTRPAGGSWSSWGSATVVSRYTERQTAYKRNDSGTTAPAFSSTASGLPYGWSSSQPSATSSNRYVWRITRTRPAGDSWSSWGSATVVSRYTERQTAYKRNDSGTTAPAFSSTASGVPYGWSSSQPSATSSNRYVWQISRTRPAGGSWSSWGSATVVSRYTERQTAYKRNDSGTTAPAFSSTASGLPYGWSSSQPSATSSNRYVWRITRTRPAGESWSSWGSATVVAKYTERQYAYRVGNSGSTAPSFSASASGIPTGWSSSRRTPGPSVPYEWQISRTRPTGESWSSWGSATVVSKYTERQSAYRRNNSGSGPPSFSATASGVPSGWSSSRQTPTSSNRYEWKISRTRPAGESWSSWGSATVVAKYTERQTAYKRNDSGTTAPAFSSTASGTPYGWSSSQPSPTSSNRYVWRISRTRPAGGSWSSWGSATVVSRYTERQSAYKRNNSGTSAPTFSATASGVPSGWSSSRQSPTSSHRYEWRIRRTRPAGDSWSSWGSATVVAKYTERQYAYRVGNSGSTAPSFSASSSGIPTGWSSSRRTPGPSVPYEWRITRTRPTGGSWSNWGSATVVNTWTASTGRYRDGLKRLGFLYAADFRQFSRSEDVLPYEKRLTPRSLDGPAKQPKEVLRTLLSTRQ